MSDIIVSASDVNFEQDVLQRATPVLLWFRAQWCGPSGATTSVIEELADDFSDIDVIAVDVDAHPEIPVNYGVQALPTLILMQQGEVVDRVSGATERARFASLFHRATELTQ